MKEWIKCAGIRAIKTFAQVMLSFLTLGMAITDVDWVYVLSVSAGACVISVLTSIVGLPELKKPNVVGDIAINPETQDAMIEFTPENGAALKLGSKVTFNVTGISNFDMEDVEEGDEES